MSEATPPPHIVLVGLMGSGKTTVGRKLANAIGRRFVDADDELEVRSGRPIADWFEKDGEDGFRRAEAELLADLLAEDEPMVLGSGGGVVVSEANRQRLRSDDVIVVYLHGTPAFLASRSLAEPHRPLLAGADPREVLTEHHRVRDPRYREVADLVVEIAPPRTGGDGSPRRLTDIILEGLRDRGLPVSRTENRP